MTTRIAMALGFVCAFAVNGSAQSPWELIPLPSDCGSYSRLTRLHQIKFDNPAPIVYMYSETTVDVSVCGFTPQVAAVLGAGIRAAKEDARSPVAYVEDQTATTWNARWSADGYHSLISAILRRKVDLGKTKEDIQMTGPPQNAYFDNPEDCQWAGYVWNYYGHGCETPGSPIVLDMGHNNIRLTSVARGVPFDLYGDGNLRQWAWTRPGSDDAWLAMDRNGNGMIDSGRELFGNATPWHVQEQLGPDAWPANGFEALKSLDDNHDGWIDGRDPLFARLLVWTDRNHNGLSEPEELQAAGAAGLVAISTDYKQKARKDRHGNEFRQKGHAVFAGGIRDSVWDVWLWGESEDPTDEP
jgi:hypothetical protein